MRSNATARSGRGPLRHAARASAIAGLIIGAGALSGGCNNAGEGALTGAGLGALVGMGLGALSGNMGEGAAAGALIGGAGGAIIGDQNERNERYNTRRSNQSMYGTAPAPVYHDYGHTTTERRVTVYRTYEYSGPSYEYRRGYRYRSPYRCR